jgi:hypothetical protein
MDTAMTNPTGFSYKRNYSVPQPQVQQCPMTPTIHYAKRRKKATILLLLEDIWTSPPCRRIER